MTDLEWTDKVALAVFLNMLYAASLASGAYLRADPFATPPPDTVYVSTGTHESLSLTHRRKADPMIEFQDGSFSDTDDRDNVLDDFRDMLEDKGEDTPPEDTPAAMHVGTEDELQEKKERRSLEQRLDDLESDVEKAKAIAKASSSPRGGGSPLPTPSPEEVHRYSDQKLIE